MPERTCPICGALGYGWSTICWKCGTDAEEIPEGVDDIGEIPELPKLR